MFNLFKKKDAATTIEIACPFCRTVRAITLATISADLQCPAPVFMCAICNGDITAAMLHNPVVAEMASALETARIQNTAAKESLEELRQPGRKEEEARQEQTALVRLEEEHTTLVKRADRVETDNHELRDENQRLRAGMEAAAAHVRLLKSQLDAVAEPSISFFIEVGDAKTGTRVKCKGCTSELALRCPKCGYYHVLTVEMRGKEREIVLLRRLESNAHRANRDPISGYFVVEAAP